MLYLVNADLHNHLKTGSDMSRISLDTVVDVARERLGERGIVGITNYADDRYEQLVGKAGRYERVNLGNAVYFPEKQILVVKGEEIPTQQGDILAVGVKEGKHPAAGRKLEETLREFKDNNWMSIAVHPFYVQGTGKELEKTHELRGAIQIIGPIEMLDAIEVHNSEAELWLPFLTPRNANQKAKDFFERMKCWFQGLGTVFSSDGHSLLEIGTSYTSLKMPDSAEIKDDNYLVEELKRAVTSHRDYSGKLGSSRLMALMHVLALAGYIAKPKISSLFSKVSSLFRKNS